MGEVDTKDQKMVEIKRSRRGSYKTPSMCASGCEGIRFVPEGDFCWDATAAVVSAAAAALIEYVRICPNILVLKKLIRTDVRMNIRDKYIRILKYSNIFVTL